jgi:2-oxoglutarate dehydrogenase E1 component
MTNWQGITALNRAYVLDLYDRFRRDPGSVDAETRALFSTWTPPLDDAEADVPLKSDSTAAAGATSAALLQKAVGAVNLAQAIRRYGHLAARLDPLGSQPVGDPSLEAATHGLTEDDLLALPPTLIDSPLTAGAANMLDVVTRFGRFTARHRVTTMRTSSCPTNDSGSDRRSRPAGSERRPIR